ncbi:MAG TPA: hypothetical protein VE130_05235 [Nitrososphaeraceae archaeon]|jgi:hypothetical protein|nr:hypothetical protein [Nitrososphaeraceae archaeon]
MIAAAMVLSSTIVTSNSISASEEMQTYEADETTQEGMNERLALSFIEEVYNNHNLSAMEKYYAKNFRFYGSRRF